ncbi:MAG: hypothetical protein AB7S26_12325 [Sandaracinaceae bacterium]
MTISNVPVPSARLSRARPFTPPRRPPSARRVKDEERSDEASAQRWERSSP